MTPQRVTLSRRKGWRMSPNTAKVDRSTIWGNPFAIIPIEVRRHRGRFEIVKLHTDGRRFGELRYGARIDIFEGTRGNALGRCVDLHAALLASPEGELMRRKARAELAGKNIACWCPQGCKCHGDNWLRVANEGDG